MLNGYDSFYLNNGKKLVLVADDEEINRELLGNLLENEYEVIFAADGEETLKQIENHYDELSLVLLDIIMPGKSGIEVLKQLREEEKLQKFPVIVITADQRSEVDSLMIGAADFIPKPYPPAGVILARSMRIIELYESRQIINATERDPLTGLYNKDFFFKYAEQFDRYNKSMKMDAIVIDIQRFHIINDRFGTSYGDDILHQVGMKLKKTVTDLGGLACRKEADTFMVYCPHMSDYKTLLKGISEIVPGNGKGNGGIVRFRMGVYAKVDKSIDIARRFDRAKQAADTVRRSYTKNICVYDSSMRDQEMFAERLVEDFRSAINEEQFKVYYQPKFDIRSEKPVLTSAEALVRWQHPQLGLIAPATFIPLFEDNGMIQELDQYVWQKVASQVKAWSDKYNRQIAVSVNVSRVDMYEPEIVSKLCKLITDNDLTYGNILLEITESAYAKESEQMIKVVKNLRERGFKVEMDDFGTGYSSLNMLSTLPIDALKLDMIFVRSAFENGQDTRIIEIVMDIAKYLDVPVVAEGVETKEQLDALRSIGCDIVQGYYFSKPVPCEEFEAFLA